jgi:hypothetical protein
MFSRYLPASTPVVSAKIQSPPPAALYLPIVLNNFSPITIFGVEMGEITKNGGLDPIRAANTTWVRRNAVLWSDVETSPGVRNWSALASMENEWLNAANASLTPIVIVRSTPVWARMYANSPCGPMAPGAIATFAIFMRDLVTRYSVPPYNVKYWEIWNEPDVPTVATDTPFGCWGNPVDPDYLGSYYAQMLQAVYPQIKAANPNAQVLMGGLLLECNPNLPALCSNNRPAKYLEGILLNNGGPYFDGVSYHAYDYYGLALGQYGNAAWNSYWNTTGPAIIAKANFVNSVLAKYGVTGKYLMSTESALLCDSCSGDSTFETTKAYYVAQAYSSAIALGLRAEIWFSVFGWRNSGLLNYDLSPLPAYTAYKFANSQLASATFAGDVTAYPGVKGYAFNNGGRLLWLLWSLDGSPHALALPSTPSMSWDVFGNPIVPSPSVTMGLMPTYFRW